MSIHIRGAYGQELHLFAFTQGQQDHLGRRESLLKSSMLRPLRIRNARPQRKLDYRHLPGNVDRGSYKLKELKETVHEKEPAPKHRSEPLERPGHQSETVEARSTRQLYRFVHPGTN